MLKRISWRSLAMNMPRVSLRKHASDGEFAGELAGYCSCHRGYESDTPRAVVSKSTSGSKTRKTRKV